MASDSSDKKLKILAILIPAVASIIVALIGLVKEFGPKPEQTIPTVIVVTATNAPTPVVVTATSAPAATRPAAIPTAVKTSPAVIVTAAKPQFNVTNSLVLPVRIYIDEVDKGVVESSAVKVFLMDSFPVKVRWSVVKETTSNGRPLGHDMGGIFSTVNSGEKLEINNKVSGQAYFYPLITNNTKNDCDVTINKGWKSENVMGASVPAKTVLVGLGYFELYTNSNVTLDCEGEIYWWGTLPNEKNPDSIYADVEAGSGVIEFTLNP